MRAGILFEEPSPSGSRPSVGFIKDLSTCSNAQLPPRLHIFGMCVVSHVGVDVQHPAVLSTQSTLSSLCMHCRRAWAKHAASWLRYRVQGCDIASGLLPLYVHEDNICIQPWMDDCPTGNVTVYACACAANTLSQSPARAVACAFFLPDAYGMYSDSLQYCHGFGAGVGVPRGCGFTGLRNG